MRLASFAKDGEQKRRRPLLGLHDDTRKRHFRLFRPWTLTVVVRYCRSPLNLRFHQNFATGLVDNFNNRLQPKLRFIILHL